MPWLIVILGYLIGSIPTAYIAGRLLKGRDIRQMGDRNMGAANAFQQLGRKTGVAVGILDAGKGALAILIAQAAAQPQVVILITGLAAVVGHNWPVFLGFKGGRGEATTIGILFTLITQPMLIMTVPTLVVLAITKKVPIASICLFVMLPLVCWWLKVPGVLIIYSLALACLVGITHLLTTRKVSTSSSS